MLGSAVTGTRCLAMEATTSTPARERAKATVCTPSRTQPASSSPVSVIVLTRRSSPLSSRTRGGSQRANVMGARGDPSRVTALTGIPRRRPACCSGSATVADASTKVGLER